MANQTLFQSLRGALVPRTDAVNDHGAPAYALAPKHALAQLAATGCLNSTFYASAEEQLAKTLALARQVDAGFLARTAVYARERGFMKDMPAVLCAVLATRDAELLAKVFPRVSDDAKMVRNFVQVLRSGVAGRKSLGTVSKRLVRQWLAGRTEDQLFRAAVGNAPSLADVIKLVHPQPATPQRAALYGYLLDRPHDAAALPELVQQFEAFKAAKAGQRGPVPDVPFQMLTALDLGRIEWTAIARRAPWQMTRMNLNTFARHGVFDDRTMVKLVAHRLADADAVKRARVFPYQLLAAFKSAGGDVPSLVRDALQDAMEAATANVPAVPGKVFVCPDVSGSMSSPVTGHRAGATTAVRCIDVAALVAATLVRQNPQAEVLPFATDVVPVRLNARDSVMTNAEKLAAIGGGGTNCSAPLAELNRRQARGDLVVFISDNESWVDAGRGRGTATMREWAVFKRFNPQARLVCIDLQPYTTTQAAEQPDVLNIGGFSDPVFEVVAAFAEGRLGADHWVGVVEAVRL